MEPVKKFLKVLEIGKQPTPTSFDTPSELVVEVVPPVLGGDAVRASANLIKLMGLDVQEHDVVEVTVRIVTRRTTRDVPIDEMG